jgi:hypothetical protein
LKEIKTLCTKLDHLVHIIDNGKESEIGVARAKTKNDNTGNYALCLARGIKQ